MTWVIEIKMYGPDRRHWHWALACNVYSMVMLGIVERAMQAGGQETRSRLRTPGDAVAEVTAEDA